MGEGMCEWVEWRWLELGVFGREKEVGVGARVPAAASAGQSGQSSCDHPLPHLPAAFLPSICPCSHLVLPGLLAGRPKHAQHVVRQLHIHSGHVNLRRSSQSRRRPRSSQSRRRPRCSRPAAAAARLVCTAGAAAPAQRQALLAVQAEGACGPQGEGGDDGAGAQGGQPVRVGPQAGCTAGITVCDAVGGGPPCEVGSLQGQPRNSPRRDARADVRCDRGGGAAQRRRRRRQRAPAGVGPGSTAGASLRQGSVRRPCDRVQTAAELSAMLHPCWQACP